MSKNQEKRRRLVIGLCVDRMASIKTYAEEIDELKHRFIDLFAGCAIAFYEMASPYPREGTDILAYDYGGMLPGCDDLLSDNSRAVIKWAEDHPNSLALVVTSFTWRNQIQIEMRDLGITLPNCLEFTWESEISDLPAEWRDLCAEPSATKAATAALRYPPDLGALFRGVDAKRPACSTFFRPSQKFCQWLRNRVADRVLIDAGCGNGHTMRELRRSGIQKVLGIDLLAEISANTGGPIPMDATTFNYPPGCTVLIARPCHGDWVTKAIKRALETASEILYVGLDKNLWVDLGDYACRFRKVGKNAGTDREGVWSMALRKKGVTL